MQELNIVKMINHAITNERKLVFDTLIASNVSFDRNISDTGLFNLINLEVEKGNKLLVNNFAILLNNIFDISPLFEKDGYSNFTTPEQKSIIIVGVNNVRKKVDLN